MARFIANERFRGIKEGLTYSANTEFEMSLVRMKELQENIKTNFPDATIEFTQLDVSEDKPVKKEPTKKPSA